MPLFRRPVASKFTARQTDNRDKALTRRNILGIGCGCCASLLLPSTRASAQTEKITAHLDAARKAAGTDLFDYLRNSECRKVAQNVIPNFKPINPIDQFQLPAPEPGRAFDNLFFVGSEWVSAWVVATSSGLILIDTMDNDEEAERLVDGGLRKLGLDPSQIKIIILTHGHGDHYGGANYFKRRYSPEIAMSAVDWTMVETNLEMDYPGWWGKPPIRDRPLEDGSKIQLGDTTIDVLLTPGHTMGTISLLFNVVSGASKHRALLWGGPAIPGKQERIQAYIESTDRARKIAETQGVEVMVTNHPFYDRTTQKLASMKSGSKNPFVMGSDDVQRALTVLHECGKATLAAW